MTIQEKAIKQLERISNHLSAIGEKEDYTDIAIQALEKEPKIEQEIRKEIKRLSTYRVCTDTTDVIADLVSVNAVERVLNLVFRGCRDKEPHMESEADNDTN